MPTLANASVSLRPVPHHPRHTGRTLQRPRCVVCTSGALERVLDLGDAPIIVDTASNDPTLADVDTSSPLRLARCDRCGVMQLEDTLDSAQRTSISIDPAQRPFAGRPDAARRFCEDAIDRWSLRGAGHIIEIGSGTGSLLRFFRAWQLPVLGIEPDPKLTRYARLRRVPTWRASFDAAIAGRIARSDMHADLLIVSTPSGATDDVAQLLAGAATVLRPSGMLTMEVPDVLRIIGRTRFDDLRHTDRMLPTIRQLRRVAASHALDLVDVERPSMAHDRLRVWLRRRDHGTAAMTRPRVRTRLRAEIALGVEQATDLTAHRVDARGEGCQGIRLLDTARRSGRTVALWGTSPHAVATAWAAGITAADVAFAAEPCAVTTGDVLPGTSIPIVGPTEINDRCPDLVLALDDLTELPPGWNDAAIYAVADLVDVVHDITGERPSRRLAPWS